MNGKRAIKKNESGKACGHSRRHDHCDKRWCHRITRRTAKRAIREGIES